MVFAMSSWVHIGCYIWFSRNICPVERKLHSHNIREKRKKSRTQQGRAAWIFCKSRSYFRIRGARMVTYRKHRKIRGLRSKFSRHGDLAPGICAPCSMWVIVWRFKLQYVSHGVMFQPVVLSHGVMFQATVCESWCDVSRCSVWVMVWCFKLQYVSHGVIHHESLRSQDLTSNCKHAGKLQQWELEPQRVSGLQWQG